MRPRRVSREVIYTAISLVKGLVVTFVNFWRKKVTLLYPEKRWELPENYRGMPVMPIDRKTGKDKCIACGSCVRICPEQIITMDYEVGDDKKRKLKAFKIDMSRCMFCGLCTEVCPTEGLVPSKIYELSSTSRDQMVFDLDESHELGGFHPDKPDEEAEDKEDAQSEI